MNKKILTCVGTRPNFIKIIKLKNLFEKKGLEYRLLHTGQHFDENMSNIFFSQLQLGKADYHLGIHGKSNNEIVGKIIIETEKILLEYKPDILIVPGDVNSTFACAFAAASLSIPVAHIESGLRSFDLTMPEERNRILTDRLSTLLFVTEPIGVNNLLNENIQEDQIYLVGNTIIDSLLSMIPLITKSDILKKLNLSPKNYVVCTFHRPVNVDDAEQLKLILRTLRLLCEKIKVVFPMHPRTLNKMKEFNLLSAIEQVKDQLIIIEPQGYIEFLKLIQNSACIISDSGGVQIESSFFNIPCFTVRETTELEITLGKGTNTLTPLDPVVIVNHVDHVLKGWSKVIEHQYLWDGNASERIVEVIFQYLSDQ